MKGGEVESGNRVIGKDGNGKKTGKGKKGQTNG